MLNELFPSGFDAVTAAGVSILAVANKDVDEWNDIIASMNPEEEHILESRDWFTEVSILAQLHIQTTTDFLFMALYSPMIPMGT